MRKNKSSVLKTHYNCAKQLSKVIREADVLLSRVQSARGELTKFYAEVETRILTESVKSILKILLKEDFVKFIPDFRNLMLELGDVLREKQMDLHSFQHMVEELYESLIRKNKSSHPARLRKSRKYKMRILYVTGMFPSTRHGGGQRIFDILKELSQRHDVDLYSSFGESDKDSLSALSPRLRDIRVVHGSLRSEDVTSWLAKKGRGADYYDIIQFEYLNSVPLMDSLRYYGKRLGFTLMESVTRHHALWLRELKPLVPRAVAWRIFGILEGAYLESQGLLKSDFAIAVTSEDSNYTKKVFGIETEVVPTGISVDNYSYLNGLEQKTASRKFSVGFIGYFDHSPNLEGILWYLKNIHGQLRRRIKGYNIVIVGGGTQVQGLKDFCKDIPGVTVTGYVEDFASVLNCCTICVAPLITGAGIRGKLHQYAAMGKPIVTTTLGANGTTYEPGISILVADEPIPFAEAVESLLKDSKLRKRISENAKIRVKSDFLSPILAKKLEQIYAQ